MKTNKFNFSDIIGTIFGVLIFVVAFVPLILMVLGLCFDLYSITSTGAGGEEVREVYNIAEMIAHNKNGGEFVFKFAYPIYALCITTVVLGAIGLIMTIVSFFADHDAVIWIAALSLIISSIIALVMCFLFIFSFAGLYDSLKGIGSSVKPITGYWIFIVGGIVGTIINLIVGAMRLSTIM